MRIGGREEIIQLELSNFECRAWCMSPRMPFAIVLCVIFRATFENNCLSAESYCIFRSRFLSFDLEQHYTLSASEYFVNPSATSILIKLSADAQFMLDGRMFDGSNLNRISIEGTGSRKPHGTVEIHSMAFYGIRAPFPEIDILNVHSAVIQNGSFFGNFFAMT